MMNNRPTRNTGPLAIALSSAFFASYGIWSVALSADFGAFTQAWTRSIIVLIAVALYMLRTQSFFAPSRKDMPLLVIIALCAGLNQAPYYFGFAVLGVGMATLLFFTTLSITGVLLSPLIYAEKITARNAIGLVIALVGLVLLNPILLSNAGAAVLVAISGVLGAVAITLPKKLSRNYPESHILMYYSIAILLINAPLARMLGEITPALTHSSWVWQLAYAASYLCANALVVYGFKKTTAAHGSVIGLLEVVLGVLFGVVLFGETLTARVMLACVTIVCGIAISLTSAQTPAAQAKKE